MKLGVIKVERGFSVEQFLQSLITGIRDGQVRISLDKHAVLDSLQQVVDEYKQAKDFDFRVMANCIYDGIYITDGEGNTLYVNSAYTRITGIGAAEVIGKSVADLEQAGLYRNAVTPEVIRQKKQVNSMAKSLRNDTPMLITGSPIFDEAGNIKKVIVIDRDITDLLAMKEQLEATQQQMQAVEKDTVKNKLEIEHLRKQQFKEKFIGKSKAMETVRNLIQHVAGLDVTVLITGETGVGKEIIANEIYRISNRSEAPFIKVNCAAIPSALLEAELFGYAKGAFTGASATGKVGLFELADKGTLLLDEIGDMPLELQSKLLRVIQHKEVTHIGGRKPIKLDVRILAATHCDLKELVRQGRFREDLYYRLNVFPIEIPPLRARAEDIETLCQHFLSLYNTKYTKAIRIDRSGLAMLKQYSWPGNVRELQNIIERLVIVAEIQAIIGTDQIGVLLNLDSHYHGILNEEAGLKEIVQTIEKKAIEKALRQGGSTRKAAKLLQIDQSTIVKKAKRLGILLSDDKCHQ